MCTPFYSACSVDFEQVNVRWEGKAFCRTSEAKNNQTRCRFYEEERALEPKLITLKKFCLT